MYQDSESQARRSRSVQPGSRIRQTQHYDWVRLTGSGTPERLPCGRNYSGCEMANAFPDEATRECNAGQAQGMAGRDPLGIDD